MRAGIISDEVMTLATITRMEGFRREDRLHRSRAEDVLGLRIS